jgi:2-(1,2-epoxy-1,2-dihydrophenyl)acetyl-CoA isomerase
VKISRQAGKEDCEMSSDYTAIRYSIENKVVAVTLDRPEVSNAFNHASYAKIREAFEKAGKDPDVGAVVLTGAGKNFSAGGDIQDMQKWIDEGDFIDEPTVALTGEMAMAVRRCPKPTIAMINRAAAGCALACDFRIFAKTAKLILAFINLGLSGDTCSMYSLARQVGTAKATELLLLGEPISARPATSWGWPIKLRRRMRLKQSPIGL